MHQCCIPAMTVLPRSVLKTGSLSHWFFLLGGFFPWFDRYRVVLPLPRAARLARD